MKRVLATVLMLAMLLPMACATGTAAAAEDYTSEPFYGMGWSDINRLKFSNLEGLTIVSLKIVDKENKKLGLSYANKTDPKEIAASIKKVMDRNPEGMRHLFLAGTAQAFYVDPEDAIFMENGVGQMKALFTELINEYKALGGKLDSLVLDTEYVWMGGWYIYSRFYYDGNSKIQNRNIYNEIVANPKYAAEVRPLLVERGFKFYEQTGGEKSEIYGIWPSTRQTAAEKAKYGECTSIWNTVMSIHMANYLNDALLEPLLACYPNAIMSDYQEDEVDAWQKSLSDTGGIRGYYGGNSITVGNASNYNTYASRPSSSFYKDSDGNYLYPSLPAYNDAVYEDDPYHMFLFDANKFKQMYASSDTKKITAWIAEYDYGTRAGSVANTPYYTETVYHIGMLDPQAFLLYIYSGDSKFKGDNGTAEYNKRMQTVSEILNELTRVAGYSDRKPIETPINWNDGFVLSGMYAGGRNIWRITPDTTEGTTLESFRVEADVPTFSINGTTVVFPQGRILSDSSISVVGSAGYWVETPKDVTPVMVRDADRYANNPSYTEDFDYADGTAFNGQTANEKQAWEATGSLKVQNGALVLTGTAALNNVKLPQNITAGDSYAKQQAWEISFTLSSALNSGASVKLLTCGADGGVKLEGGKVYYDRNGEYKELSGVTLSAGQKYTLKREVNLTAETSTYSLYKDGSLVKQAAGVPAQGVTQPVTSIGFACDGLSVNVALDDYKLYPTGLAQDLEVYNGENGVRLDTSAKSSAGSVAYRLSWLNGTNTGRKVNVKAAQYNSEGALISEKIIRTVEMAPGCDSVETGIVNNTGGKLRIYLEDAGSYTPEELPDYEEDDYEWGTEPTAPPVTQSTDLSDLPDEPMPTAPPSEPVETEPSAAATAPSVPQSTAGQKQTSATKATAGAKPATGNQTAATKATSGNQTATVIPTSGSQSAAATTAKPIQGVAITRPTKDSGNASVQTTESLDGPSAIPTEGYADPTEASTGAYEIPAGETEDPASTPTEAPNDSASLPTEPNSQEPTDPKAETKPEATEIGDLVEEPQVKNGLSGGTIALIVVGALLVCGGAAAGIIFYLKKKPTKN